MSEFRPNRKPSARRSTKTEQSQSRARKLRTTMSPPERKLWVRLRGRQVLGLRFRRQHPVGPYALDFYCDEAKLAVELDGHQHRLDPERDRRRDEWVRAHGIETLRIPVWAFEQDIGHALHRIAQAARARLAALSRIHGAEVERVEDEAPSAAAKPAAPPPAGEDGRTLPRERLAP